MYLYRKNAKFMNLDRCYRTATQHLFTQTNLCYSKLQLCCNELFFGHWYEKNNAVYFSVIYARKSVVQIICNTEGQVSLHRGNIVFIQRHYRIKIFRAGNRILKKTTKENCTVVARDTSRQ